MADVDLLDNEDVVSADQATVNYLYDTVDKDDHTADLKRRALEMYNQVNVPVRSAPNNVIGAATLLECSLCYALIMPKTIAVVTHMKTHLQAERRGDIG